MYKSILGIHEVVRSSWTMYWEFISWCFWWSKSSWKASSSLSPFSSLSTNWTPDPVKTFTASSLPPTPCPIALLKKEKLHFHVTFGSHATICSRDGCIQHSKQGSVPGQHYLSCSHQSSTSRSHWCNSIRFSGVRSLQSTCPLNVVILLKGTLNFVRVHRDQQNLEHLQPTWKLNYQQILWSLFLALILRF